MRYENGEIDLNKNKRSLLVLPSVGWLIMFTVVPLVIMLLTSFQPDDGTGFTLQNYIRFFSKATYLKLTWRTIVNSFLVTFFSLILGYPLAYLMAKKMKNFKLVLLALIMIPFFTNQLVRVYSWLIFLQDGGILESVLKHFHIIGKGGLGILYTKVAVIIGLVHAYFPYMVITIYMALERMDDKLLEASYSLGANKITTFFKVIFPVSMPGVISGIMIVFVPCLGSFVEPRILGGTNGTVIGTVIESQFMEVYGWDFGAAIAFILLVMVLISMNLLNLWGRRYES